MTFVLALGHYELAPANDLDNIKQMQIMAR